MKIYKVTFPAKAKFCFLALLILAISQILLACGSTSTDTTVVPTVNSNTVKATPLAPTSIPEPNSATSCNINVKNKGYTPLSTVQIENARSQCIQILDQNFQKWESKKVVSYEIEVTYQGTYFHAFETYDYTVKNGQIVQKKFEAVDKNHPSGTTKPVQMTPTFNDGLGLTVEGLFANVRSLIEKGAWEEDAYFKATFDQDYGYPKSFISDSIRYTDSAYTWDVVSIKFNP